MQLNKLEHTHKIYSNKLLLFDNVVSTDMLRRLTNCRIIISISINLLVVLITLLLIE